MKSSPLLILLVIFLFTCGEKELPYSTVETWDEMVAGNDYKYVTPVRISDPGTEENPAYTGFWFYDEQQFDASGRYALAMKVYFKEREVNSSDVGDIGYIDLEDNNKWTKIGETTAWNWQQGCRLQWRPGSEEILWNDHNDDKTGFVCRVYNFKTGKLKLCQQLFTTLPMMEHLPSPMTLRACDMLALRMTEYPILMLTSKPLLSQE